ncbi:MAG TPA: RloB family protein [Micromonosporaceae bacterium]|nr:RloB family protein [Micromonosporaceae bacterium]
MIATNGQSTEKSYLESLRAEPWVRSGKITVAFIGGSPLDLVRGAARRRDAEDYDDAWAVCDVDSYETDNAIREATRADIELLWSNPCFEVWLILHRTECTVHFDNAKQCHKKLVSVLGRWDKSQLSFDDFKDGIKDAWQRAKALDDPPSGNPSTAVWRLVEDLCAQEPERIGQSD